MKRTIIDAQLQKNEAVLRQGIVRVEKINISIGQRPAHIADGRPVPLREVREKPHSLQDWRTAYSAERRRAAIRTIQSFCILKV